MLKGDIELRFINRCNAPCRSTLAQTALKFPSLARTRHGHDIEIESLLRIFCRKKRNLAEKRVFCAIVATRLKHLQTLVVPAVCLGRFLLISSLNDRDIWDRFKTTRREKQRAHPDCYLAEQHYVSSQRLNLAHKHKFD